MQRFITLKSNDGSIIINTGKVESITCEDQFLKVFYDQSGRYDRLIFENKDLASEAFNSIAKTLCASIG